MDAVEYLKQLKRMCNGRRCNECPLRIDNDALSPCVPYKVKDEKMNVEIVEKWAKEHPTKTRQSEFLKMFPKANVLGEAMNIRPCDVDTDAFKGCANFITYFHCMRKYWSEEIE